MQCKFCGAQIDDGRAMCEYCGTAVEKPTDTTETSQGNQTFGSSYYTNHTINGTTTPPQGYYPSEDSSNKEPSYIPYQPSRTNADYNAWNTTNNGYQPQTSDTGKSYGLGSLIAGCATIFLLFSSLSIVAAIVSFVLGSLSRKHSDAKDYKMAKAGMIIAGIGAGLTLALYFLIAILYFSSGV